MINLVRIYNMSIKIPNHILNQLFIHVQDAPTIPFSA
jgi:hypothetical protein